MRRNCKIGTMVESCHGQKLFLILFFIWEITKFKFGKILLFICYTYYFRIKDNTL